MPRPLSELEAQTQMVDLERADGGRTAAATRERRTQQVEELVDRDPERVASQIRQWMTERLMAVELYQQPQAPTPPAAARAPGRRGRSASTAARRRPCCSSRSGPSVPPRSSSTSTTTRSSRCRWRWRRCSTSSPTSTTKVMEELAATVQAYDSLAAGGVDYARDVLERAIGTRARRRDHRPPLLRDRDAAVRVPAPHRARADRRVPAQRGAADDRAGRRQPAHHARRPGALQPPRGGAGGDRAADREDGRDQPGRRQAGRGRDARQARDRSSRTSTRPPVASSRWPRSSTTPTARPSATCSTR